MCGHQVLVYGALFLWILAVYEIMWSMLMFMLFDDILVIMGGVLITTFVFLSGVVMLPTNLFILHRLSNGKQLNQNTTLFCCPLWICFLWVIILNVFGAMLCIQKLACSDDPCSLINKAMKGYKNTPRAKSFMDDLQLHLKCCGKNSYKDWFHYDWYDRIQDYGWDPNSMAPQLIVDDSVPVSCCKSGYCIANYLTELGTHTINTRGCCEATYNIIVLTTFVHLLLFLLTVVIQICVFKLICDNDDKECDMNTAACDIEQIMSVHSNFNLSSTTDQTVYYETDKELDISSTINESGEEEIIKEKRSKFLIFSRSKETVDIN